MEKLLTVKDLCEYLQVSQALVYKCVHYHYVTHIKIGKVLRFKESQIERWSTKRQKIRGKMWLKWRWQYKGWEIKESYFVSHPTCMEKIVSTGRMKWYNMYL